MALTDAELVDIVADLVKPGSGKHERVRTHIQTLLTIGVGMPSADVLFEQHVRIHEVRGRIDALLGRTIFEFKSNLKAEMGDAKKQLLDYLTEREEQSGESYIGIATDGAEFRVFERQAGSLVEIGAPFLTPRDRPRRLLEWLESTVAARDDVAPEPEIISFELGRKSVAYGIARRELGAMWDAVAAVPDVILKRQLWAQQLERVYGSSIDSDELFFQHTYLTIVAKTMATAVVGVPLPDPADLLSGQAFEDAAISGAVESDFFDWVLEAPESRPLIRRIARQVMRFRLRDVHVDVLKGLYESLIDPEQRHDLGEYYTPDWLAARICERAIADPLHQRVLDPACGSGTFVFHAVRRFLAAADAAGMDNRTALHECGQKVFGIDVHPVAAIIARVTYLLALGDRLRDDRDRVDVPVYLGDSLQWNTQMFLTERSVRIVVPGGPDLQFPATVAASPAMFDSILSQMLEVSEQGADPETLRGWLETEYQLREADRQLLTASCAALSRLHREDRDHIWGYVARNMSRPVWLSSDGNRADVVVGNPPWLALQFMNAELRQRFREESQRLGVWDGGRGRVSHQDLSGYAFARFAELYARPGGTIALVMPLAAMSRGQFKSFRSGWFGFDRGKRTETPFAMIRFTEGWTFDATVKRLFKVPSCVLFATRGEPGSLPITVTAFSGELPRHDATPIEAQAALSERQAPWPAERQGPKSPYGSLFRQGAIILPRVLFVVDRVSPGALGANAAAPIVVSHRSRQEKRPWRDRPALRGPVDAAFLRPLALGESIAPYRVLGLAEAVIPADASGHLQTATEALAGGSVNLSRWIRDAEAAWAAESGEGSIVERLDFYRQLSTQFPIAPLRVLFAASGTIPAACVIRHATAIVEHKLYWAAVDGEPEAHYLASILSSETARQRVERMQSEGQWGARDFDKVMFELPIPKFDPSEAVHSELAVRGAEAEAIAAGVDVSAVGFVAARGRIRAALKEDGAAGKIDALVARLLDG